MCTELLEDSYFKDIATFFKVSIFFSGTFNTDDHKQANDSLLDQFLTISDYRTKLIDTFVSDDIEPFPIGELVNSEARCIHDKEERREAELKELKVKLEEQTHIIDELRAAHLQDEQKAKAIIEKLLATTKKYEGKLTEQQEKEGQNP